MKYTVQQASIECWHVW